MPTQSSAYRQLYASSNYVTTHPTLPKASPLETPSGNITNLGTFELCYALCMNDINLDLSFIDKWDNITPQEIKGIETLKKGVNLIFENIPPENIVSIYLKGSFYRREMNKDSDVDVSVVVDDDKYLDNLYDLQKKFGNSKDLNFGFGGYSISELKTGKLSEHGNTKRANTGTL